MVHVVFCFGPALVPILMILGSFGYYPWRHYDSGAAYTILWGFAFLASWHIALVVKERPRLAYVVFAVGNLGAYVMLGFYGLVLVTGDSL